MNRDNYLFKKESFHSICCIIVSKIAFTTNTTHKMVAKFEAFFLLSFLLAGLAHGKIYERCELARELKKVHKAPASQLATWVCIAYHESRYNTRLVSKPNKNGSRDHGLFQINDKYWCSPPGTGKGCGKPCAKFEDDKIADDYVCVQTIFKETERLKGDGFKAWTVYEPYCKGGKANEYIKGCF